MRLAATLLVSATMLAAQGTTKNPIVDTSKMVFGIAKNDVLKSADKIPEATVVLPAYAGRANHRPIVRPHR